MQLSELLDPEQWYINFNFSSDASNIFQYQAMTVPGIIYKTFSPN